MFRKRSDFTTMSDNELIAHYKLYEDKECIGELYKRYTGFTYAVCLKYHKNSEKAREATLEIFEELIDKLLVHEVQNFKSWLHTVARNHCLLSFRSKKYESQFIDNYKKYQNDFMEQDKILYPDYITKEENYKELEKCINQLKDEQRNCIVLFYLQNKSYVEVAEITGYTMKEVKSFLQNGKRNLKILMSEKNE
ncbi:MAG: sigma-70 family RNA polymerase sigma factor [Bacteroidales bacterium]|nr:sigma-70 family RNA polymerase sigma factor [Bacteroidales bacterium]